MKNTPSPQKRMSDALLQLARTQSIATVFDDFLDFSLRFLRWWDLKPEDFHDLEKKYPETSHYQLFAEAYLAMADIADDRGQGFRDPFGWFFEEHLSSKYTGQFFTPETVCDFIAQIQITEDMPDDATVGDPCCGSGRLLLSAAKINRNARFYGADIDLRCCRMTVINMLLNAMRGGIYWMNSLTNTVWRTWKVDRILHDNGHYLPYYTTWEGGPSPFQASFKQDDETGPAPAPESPKKSTKKKEPRPPKEPKQPRQDQLVLNFNIEF